jgi:nucleotide-binding universal stress UspA family protein
MRSILLATDGSDNAKRAFGEAVELARATGALLSIVSVDDSLTGSSPQLQMASQLAAKEAARLDVPATPLNRYGAAGPAIADTAREIDADLIVVGTHGRSSAAAVILGSVASGVVAHASCPVMVVKGDER